MLFQVPVGVSLEKPSIWADSLERFRSRGRSLSSAWVKGTGWLSSSGLGAPHSAVSVMSLDSESEIDSMVTFGSGTETGRPGLWAMGRRNISTLNMVLVLATDDS